MRQPSGRSSRLYVYKLVADNGGAPCIYKDRLSLAICKPSIRRTAREGDWVFGFGGKGLGRRLIYIACVDERVEKGAYYVDYAYQGRPDRIYRRSGGRFILREGARYHGDGRALTPDLGEPPLYGRAVTLLSGDFRYWGKKGTSDYRRRYPAVAALLDRLGRGHRVNLSNQVRQELVELRDAQWRAHPNTKVLGPPSQGDRRKACNRSEGGIRSARLESVRAGLPAVRPGSSCF